MYILKNENLTAQISKNPFELVSLKKDGKEYVYQQDSTWKKSWPICFPITGKLINDQYRLDDKTYHMTGYGFFRAITDWKVVTQTTEMLVVEYVAAKTFYDQYPFTFKLEVTYKLVGTELINKVKITNLDSKPLPYNFGWHPAFICDDHLGKIIFDQPQIVTHIPGGAFLGTTMTTEVKNEIGLDEYDFATGQCYALLNQTTEQVLIVDPIRVIRLTTKGYPNVLVWKCQNDAKYICVEPWDGHQDDVNYATTPFDQKPWINHLAPQATKEYLLQVELKK
ncbi:MAG: aldose epimerase [Spiroplasma poulsonii]|uniref:Aldose 1-epimerase n=1 Tax=Spiroplasma poulsonii TaxID=2138 RepID=A0A2P6FEQ7_9MOLU|nr:aldose epimerase [Spiroplasma poulsonii]KAF0850301.1 Aldose 1-epimerase [Spiroplasma poulsonii]MBW1242068.1 aldose epimerase [Spiroplasma poulsonii]PQM31948.1 Aldose 1-epimerase [Spiroplasma poulsonii]PWF94417.1 Aldose 1-epimerase [Spiroplasma poulsonii]PWF96986.1 Aldose 1-epimerase [Spiroplasma poulsonii]